MKKLAAIPAFLLAASLTLTLTGCKNNEGLSDSGESSVVDSGDSGDSGDFGESKEENSGAENVSKHYVYGEATIPDFHAKNTYQGSESYEKDGRGALTEEELAKTLESMAFESETVGGYKYSFVGENVRTDSENYPGFIYMTKLYIEVEKDGKVTGKAEYSRRDDYGFYITKEALANRDWIYFDVYQMDYPIIAAMNFPLWQDFEVEFFAVKDGSPIKLTGDFSNVGGEKSVIVSRENMFEFYKSSEKNTLLNLYSGKRFTFYPDKIASGDAPQYAVERYFTRDSDSAVIPDYIIDKDSVSEYVKENGIVFPTEFTDDDLEVQKFLKETSNDASFLMYMGGMFDPDWGERRFVFPQRPEPPEEQLVQEYFPLPGFYSSTLEELRGELSKYFTKEIVDTFMNATAKGTFTENADGTYSWVITQGDFNSDGTLALYPQIIECDGRLYRSAGGGETAIDGYWDSARILSKTDKEIYFTYVYRQPAGLDYNTGRLVYEDGWKYSWHVVWVY